MSNYFILCYVRPDTRGVSQKFPGRLKGTPGILGLHYFHAARQLEWPTCIVSTLIFQPHL